jgi:glycosyltransferase involved in cell wall biosynthesis
MPRPLSILCILRDPLPPRRADVLTLFGVELPRHGIRTALVGQAESPPASASAPASARATWPGGALHLAGRFGGAVNSALAPLFDSIGLLRGFRVARPDCLQVRDKVVIAVLARLFAALLHIPLVYWMSFPIVEGYAARAQDGHVRGSWLPCLQWLQWLQWLRAWSTRALLYRLVLPGAALVFVQSAAMADAMAARGLPRSRLVAVPMGVDLALVNTIIPATDPRLDGRTIIVYLGSVARARASTFLLDLAAALDRPGVLLVIAGDAPSPDEAAWFRAELARRDLGDKILFTGWLAHAAALGYVARAQVAIAPIPRGVLFDVSSPTKLVEYLALGIPAVASDIPDQRFVLEQSGAGHCVPMTVPAFHAAIVRLLDDPNRRAHGERGQAWVRAHRGYDVIGREVAAHYRGLLAPGEA